MLGNGTLLGSKFSFFAITPSTNQNPTSPQRPVMASLPGAEVKTSQTLSGPGFCSNINWATCVGVAFGKAVGVVAGTEEVLAGGSVQLAGKESVVVGQNDAGYWMYLQFTRELV